MTIECSCICTFLNANAVKKREIIQTEFGVHTLKVSYKQIFKQHVLTACIVRDGYMDARHFLYNLTILLVMFAQISG